MNQQRAVGDGAELIVDIVTRAEAGVVSAVAREFGVFEDIEVAVVEVLVRGEAIAGLEEEICCVFVP
jgi:hypothetical protein